MSTAIPATETPFEVVVSGENQKAVLEVVVFFHWFVNLGINLCHDKP
jgi:hypothetical protein